MNVGFIYTITLGEHSDKYVCVLKDPIGYKFKRVRLPLTKIDAVRLPENIYISEFGRPMIKSKRKSK